MNIQQLTQFSGTQLFACPQGSDVLQIREQGHYRWLQSGDNIIQSIMDISKPTQVVLPVYQAMLMFVLWIKKPVNLLNLGMGMGIFERALLSPGNAGIVNQLTSVEQDIQCIQLAKQFFLLPEQTLIKQQSAQSILRENSPHYEVILCDLFDQGNVASCLYDAAFYQQCSAHLTAQGVMLVNIMVNNEQQLMQMLTLAHGFFAHSALIEFPDYRNILVVYAHQPLPDKSQLLTENARQKNGLSIDFSESIKQWCALKG